jgi:sugar-specific transcriptional regulator TrmB
MDDSAAIQGLKRLGLTTYEARVFTALQKLGQGSASDISELADVPRSQVYGAAEGLEKRGLVETRQSTPTVYRPVPLEQARRHLLDQLAETGAEAFDYLETVQNTHEQEERSESIWLLNGSEPIRSRTVELIDGVTDQVLYAADDPGQVDEEILAALEAAAADATVVLASTNPTVLELPPEGSPIRTYRVPEERNMDVTTQRLLVADGETLLLSTASTGVDEGGEEVAFWTSENVFAAVIVELAREWLRSPFDGDDTQPTG